MEKWKVINDYPNYLISDRGRVLSVGRVYKAHGRKVELPNELKAINVNGRGYPTVKLYKYGKYKSIAVHRLVAQAFIPNPLRCVKHIDGNKLNNHVTNLKWSL